MPETTETRFTTEEAVAEMQRELKSYRAQALRLVIALQSELETARRRLSDETRLPESEMFSMQSAQRLRGTVERMMGVQDCLDMLSKISE